MSPIGRFLFPNLRKEVEINMTAITANAIQLPFDWVRTPLTEWLVRNDVKNIHRLTSYAGLGWETGAKLVRGKQRAFSAPTRNKLVRLGVPRALITAHLKSVAKSQVRKNVSSQILALASKSAKPADTVSYSDSVDNAKIDALIKSQDEIKQLLRSVGSKLLHFEVTK